MFYEGKIVLVTGGSGFVGSHIVQELLKSGAKVRVTVHKSSLITKDRQIKTIRADLTKQRDCLAAVKGVDYVFHAAGAVAAFAASAAAFSSSSFLSSKSCFVFTLLK